MRKDWIRSFVNHNCPSARMVRSLNPGLSEASPHNNETLIACYFRWILPAASDSHLNHLKGKEKCSFLWHCGTVVAQRGWLTRKVPCNLQFESWSWTSWEGGPCLFSSTFLTFLPNYEHSRSHSAHLPRLHLLFKSTTKINFKIYRNIYIYSKAMTLEHYHRENKPSASNCTFLKHFKTLIYKYCCLSNKDLYLQRKSI